MTPLLGGSLFASAPGAFHPSKTESVANYCRVSGPTKLHSFQELGAKTCEIHGNSIASNRAGVLRSNKKRVIQAILQSEREIETTNGIGTRGLRGQLNKVVLAYSGGLDTSVIVPWLRENYGCEVVCFTADVGQGMKELEGLEKKARASGACQLVVKDLKEEFLRDFIFPCLRAGARDINGPSSYCKGHGGCCQRSWSRCCFSWMYWERK